MTTYTAALGGGNNYPGADLRLDLSVAGSDANANTTTIAYKLYLRRGGTGGQSTYSGSQHPYGLVIGGQNLGGTSSYDFRSTSGRGSVGAESLLRQGTVVVGNSPDGTGSAAFSFSFDDQSPEKLLGDGSGSGSFGLPTLKVIPGIPTSVSAARVSDSQSTLSWSQTSASNGQPTSNEYRRRVNGGAWSSPSTIAPATSVNDATAANQKIEYQVRGTNSAGSSDWSTPSAAIYTTPGTPSAFTATKVGSDIQLAWTPNVAYSEHQHVVEHGVDVAGVVTWDGSPLATVPGGTSAYTHVSPNAAQRHVYRLRARTTDVSAISSPTVTSNVVVLLTAPGKPAVPAPPAFANRAAALRFAWAHNSIDSTTQTKYQVRYSLNGGSTWTTGAKTASTDQFIDFAANTWSANQAVTFAVRTKGGYDSGSDADASYSPWSDPVTVTFKSRPVVTIAQPVQTGTWPEAELDVQLGFAQAEGATFVRATIVLSQGATVVETLDSTTLSSTRLATRVRNGETYAVSVTVLDSNGLTSAAATATFDVEYTLPVEAETTIEYLRDSGIAQIGIVLPTPGAGEVAAASVTITRAIDGVEEEVVANYPVTTPEFTILDTTPTIHGVNTYRVRTISEDGAIADVVEDLVTDEEIYAFLSTGPGYSVIVTFWANLSFDSNPEREKVLVPTAGRKRGIPLFGDSGRLDVSGAVDLVPGAGSTRQEIEDFILTADVVCYRDPSGRRIFGMVSGRLSDPSSLAQKFTYTVSESST